MSLRAAVFDMDGTILNTLDDLRDSLNYALERAGRRHDYTNAQVGLFFGSGAEAAVGRALCLEEGQSPDMLERVGTPEDNTLSRRAPEIQAVMDVFRVWYPAHCELQTRPYEGVPELLRQLRARGMRIAVVSNKLDAAAKALAERHFPGLFDAVLGEREPEIRRKPAPDMTLTALREMGVSPAEAVYIGDSEIDLLTAKNSGMKCVAVSWGFRDRAFLLRRGAEAIADTPEQLLDILIANPQ